MAIKDRKEREKAHKREEIIKAAEKVFFKKGFEGTTMDDIADKAEFSKGTLYLYFKNKEALYSAIALRSMDIFAKILEKEIAKGNNAKEKLEAIKNAYLKFYLKYPEHMRVLLFAFRYIPLVAEKDTNELMIQFQEKQAYFTELITSVIKEAKEDSSLEISTTDASIEELFFGGGMILESIFRGIFDLEKLLKDKYDIKPEHIIRVAYKLLKF